MKIALVANTSWYLYNFRENLIKALLAHSYEVFAIAPADGYEKRLQNLGVNYIEWQLDGSSVNPFMEMQALRKLRKIVATAKVELLLSYTPKANIYCGLISYSTQAKVLMNVSGLGQAFGNKGALYFLSLFLYRLAFHKAEWVFFQNQEDMLEFQRLKLVDAQRCERINGSGVDLAKFAFSEIPTQSARNVSSEKTVFILIARLLWSKGIKEYVGAARLLKSKYPNIQLNILGILVAENKGGVAKEQLEQWSAEGIINYLGSTDDVREYIAAADCVVLPSFYKEGVPRILLEAGSMGKPIITTNHPGCRDAVTDQVTGFLAEPKSIVDLANKMEKFINLDHQERRLMANAARKKIATDFDEKKIIQRYTEVINSICQLPNC